MMDAASFISTNCGKPVLIEGRNFSGRTDLLRRWVIECTRERRRAIYVGPSVHQSISSLVPTVRDELHLHLSGTPHAQSLLRLAESFGLSRCFRQNPFTLSGGEQTLLVALCKLGLAPALLALDGAIEELDRHNAALLDEVFSSAPAEMTAVVLTINGYPEDRPWQSPTALPVTELTSRADDRAAPRFDASDFLSSPVTSPGSLAAEGVAFAYRPGAPVLTHVSFELEPGQIYSLEGRNGAGKSTLARILVGVLPYSRGRITFAGRPCDPWKAPGQVAVMHMQNPDVQLFASTVAEELADLPGPSRQGAATLAGVRHLLNEHPFDLPFVFRKRLTFSAVAHLNRPWLIFDEPTLGQDAAACDQMVAVLKRIASVGAGVIVISHSREFIRRLNARRLRLENGQISEQVTATNRNGPYVQNDEQTSQCTAVRGKQE